MDVQIHQHAVGQGGFLTGEISCGQQPLYWAYDCGSNQSMPLNREIAAAASKGPFGLLFLSHLDSDHINGIDRLLATTSVTEIVLPYLEEADLALAIGADVDSGRLAGLFLDYADNPISWFVSRGVRRITFVRPNDEDGQASSDGPLPLAPEGRDRGDGPVEVKWSRVVQVQQMPGYTIQIVDSSAVLHTKTSSDLLDWILAPYAIRPSRARAGKFLKSLRRMFGRRSLKSIILEVRSVDGREKIRACYDDVWADHNLVSMALYSGPLSPNSERWIVESFQKRFFGREWARAAGWISTGDMNLARIRRRNLLAAHYRLYAPSVGGLVLPHHGSMHSFHPSLLDVFPNLHAAIVSAGKNIYGHPHPGVRDAVHGHNRAYFIHVNEAPASSFWMNAQTTLN